MLKDVLFTFTHKVYIQTNLIKVNLFNVDLDRMFDGDVSISAAIMYLKMNQCTFNFYGINAVNSNLLELVKYNWFWIAY